MKKLVSTVSRGKNAGHALFPHQHKDGRFVVSRTRFAKDYIYVGSEADLACWVARGYAVRMSNPRDLPGVGASLKSPASILFS